MKVLSLFSGIGAFEKSLDRLGINYELVGFSEIDKYAVKSYCAIHGVDESMNLGDITKIDEKSLPKYIDLITYGFPCQDISLAGKQKGLFNEDGTQTRSGLFFEALRIIEETKPRVAIAENVKNITSKKFNAQFQVVLESLEQAGYNNYWKVLNAKDFGIPQNRERVFIVSIRKDIDTGCFQFPEGFPLQLRLKDMLEDEVDEKYYLKKEPTKFFEPDMSKDVRQVAQMYGTEVEPNPSGGRVYDANYCMRTLGAGNGMSQPIIAETVCLNSKGGRAGIEGIQPSIQDRVYDSEAISTAVTTGFMPSYAVYEPKINRIDIPQVVSVRKYEVDTDALCDCLMHHKALLDLNNNGISNALDVPVTTVEHWFRKDNCFSIPDPDIWLKLKELLKIETDEFDEAIMTFEEKEGVFDKSERHYMSDLIAPTLTRTTADEKIIEPSLRIRKLTPKECFRLMDFEDEDFEKAEAVNSNTQLYKQAENSIVVACLYYIFNELIDSNILNVNENKGMELKIKSMSFPEAIEFNFIELKQELEIIVEQYKGLVYTDDQVKEAKKDVAALRKFTKALSDERIKVKKECLKPYEEFESRINELSEIVNEPISLIDKQVKEYEEQKKQEKMDSINAYWNECEHPEDLSLEKIFDKKWLNASTYISKVKKEITEAIQQFSKDMATLATLPEYSFESQQTYISTLDITKAINEANRLSEMAKKKAESEEKAKAEEAKAEEVEIHPESEEFAFTPFAEPGQTEESFIPSFDEVTKASWVGFKAEMTNKQVDELMHFFEFRNIQFTLL